MNLIKRIKIEKIKGKDLFEVTFTDLTANQPNIVVAPNGYGKSTIATAFKACASGRIKLDAKDMYHQDINNHPKLEIELLGDNAGTFISTDVESDISAHMSVYTISSPLYAKSTTRSFGRRITGTADLRVEQVIVYDSIPEAESINYTYRSISRSFGDKSKLFLNISEMLSDYDNISKLFDIKDSLSKCCNQVRIQRKFNDFLDNCHNNGTASNIKCQISLEEINSFRENISIATLFECIDNMNSKPEGWCDVDTVFTAIQLCKTMKQYYDFGDNGILKRVYDYMEYKETRALVDQRLDAFNTTGRNIRTREEQGKLIVSFERADSMSNGERDILSFVANLTKFEKHFRKQVGILIIDEIFDYLDGSNILAVQYYLTELIRKCKDSGKVLFPIILTHLDPEVFSNYYFRKRKIHYISSFASLELDIDAVRLLRLRESRTLSDLEKEEIEKYYLHYIDEDHALTEELSARIAANFFESNTSFRAKLYSEIINEYLSEHTYSPVMVIAGLRIKIEEKVYQQLDTADRCEFICQHKVINKLIYAEEKGVDVPELFYLLQPLYNDGLHLGGDDNDVRRKIKSCYLKTDNLHVRRMIEMLFSQESTAE